MKKRLIWVELIVFIILLAIGINRFYDAVRYKDTGSGGGTDNFYSINVPIDVIVFGSSHAACTVNNGLLWNEAGIASYTLTAGAQKGDGTAFFVKEAIAKNKPKVALIETYLLGDVSYEEGSFYRTALTSRFSGRYVDYVTGVVKRNGLGREMLEGMLLRLPMVHSRYKELTKADFELDNSYILGYQGSHDCEAFEAPELIGEGGGSESDVLSVDAAGNIEEIIKVCRENGVEPVFFSAPYVATTEQQRTQNAIQLHIEALGGTYIDYLQEYASCGIDFSSDFRDYEHLNDFGAEKITKALLTFLQERYELPDRRGQNGYDKWEDYARYLSNRQLEYRLKSCADITEYMNLVSEVKGDYTVIVSLNGNYRALGDELFEGFLGDFGVDHAGFENGGAWIFSEGNSSFSSNGTAEFTGYAEIGGADVNLFKAEADEFAHILVDGLDYSPSANGISITLFDQRLGYVIDSAYADIYEGLDVQRTE
ncbi:MAG: hypothetical protein II842_18375 [Butyrivibrio sp.]|nr:hypothetical protein [Butyrivibrio sp.]